MLQGPKLRARVARHIIPRFRMNDGKIQQQTQQGGPVFAVRASEPIRPFGDGRRRGEEPIHMRYL